MKIHLQKKNWKLFDGSYFDGTYFDRIFKLSSVKLAILKPLHVQWISEVYQELSADKHLVINGFKGAYVLEALDRAKPQPRTYFEQDNPFL